MSRRHIITMGCVLVVTAFPLAPIPAAAQPRVTEAVAARAVWKPPPGMIAALQRDLHLTKKQVETRLANETRLAATEAALRQKLGNRFGGSWLAGTVAQNLVIATTSGGDIPRILATGARAEVVTRSLADLATVKREVDDALPTRQNTGSVRYIDVRTNKVVILSKEVAAASNMLESSGVDPVAVRIEASNETPQPLDDLVGGTPYYIGGTSRCSIGFSVIRGAQKGFVTAGHCGKQGNTTTSTTGTPQGVFQASVFPDSDYAWVLVNSNWTPTPKVNAGTGDTVVVAGSRPAIEGASVCRAGSTTGWHCGLIQQRDTSVTYPQGTIYQLVRTNVCAEPGDSGGSFISVDQAQGVTSGGSGDCTSGGVTYFQPVDEILTAYGLTLVTAGTAAPPTVPPVSPLCSGYPKTATGRLSAGQSAYQPGTYYRTTVTGVHAACLDGVDGVDFDLFLQKWTGSAWSTVATSDSPKPDEQISFTGTPGYYRYRVVSARGSGAYVLKYKTP